MDGEVAKRDQVDLTRRRRSGEGASTSGFRRRTSLSDEADGLVSRAIARAKENDRDAIAFLYQRYADNVYGYVRSILRDDYEAEDVTQQVFAKLITVIGQYERRTAPFSGWILRVAHNVALDHMRRQRMIPCEEVHADNEASTDDHERLWALREALGSLPTVQRQVLMMRHVAGLSPVEIADRLGKTEGSIHGLHHRGRRALQQTLIEYELAPALAAG